MGTSDSHMDITKIISGPTLVLEKDNVHSDALCHQLRAIGISEITVVESVEELERCMTDGPCRHDHLQYRCRLRAILLTLLKNIRSTTRSSLFTFFDPDLRD